MVRRYAEGLTSEGIWTITESSKPMPHGVFLLFAKGKRPSVGDIKAFVGSNPAVSLIHDPSAGAPIRLASDQGEPVAKEGLLDHSANEVSWVELLREGLAFDLIGLAPGDGFPVPDVEHLFDLKEQPGSARFEALHLTPGHHLAGGERTMPVARGLIGLACDLVQHFAGIEAIAWPPSKSASSRQYFESVTMAWLGGGPFPALGLTAFRETFDGALQSVGLDFWLDQELRIEPPLSTDKVAATRLGVRLINQLIIVGGVEGSERIVAPDGSRLVFRPSRNGKFIRVWRE